MFRFPHPTGRHGIGTLTYHWVDADRPEAFTADPDDRRELMVQLWYPAPPDPAAPRAPYLAQDAVFTLDQLVALNRADPNGIRTGRLDLQRAGLFGMSMAPSWAARPAGWSGGWGPAC